MNVREHTMNIRPYNPSDRHAVIELWTVAFGNPDDHNSPEHSLDRKLRFDKELLFVAVDGNNVIGTVMGGYDGHRGWVYSLAVHPDCRRKGAGTRLVRHLETCLRELGCPKLNLQVRATNSGVLSFYKSLGYLVEDRVSMGKRINR